MLKRGLHSLHVARQDREGWDATNGNGERECPALLAVELQPWTTKWKEGHLCGPRAASEP